MSSVLVSCSLTIIIYIFAYFLNFVSHLPISLILLCYLVFGPALLLMQSIHYRLSDDDAVMSCFEIFTEITLAHLAVNFFSTLHAKVTLIS